MQKRGARRAGPSDRHAGGHSRPTRVWLCRPAWREERPAASWVALPQAVPTGSPDRLPSRWPRDWAGPPRLEGGGRTRWVRNRGVLSLDEPGLAKPLATALAKLPWGASRQEPKPGYGLALVRRGWMNGRRRRRRGLRRWPTGGPSSSAVAWEGCSDARQRRHGWPASGRFEAG
jgi:hypothetical protein